MTKREKLFTPEAATRSLPLVSRIVEDILTTGQRMRAIGTVGNPTAEQVKEYAKLTRSLRELFEEIEHLGCYYKDWNFTVGLVDFPAQINGRRVLLCWRSDEPELRYFHDSKDGYAGRREIPRALLPGRKTSPLNV